MKNTIALSPTVARSKANWFGLAWKGTAWALLLGSIAYYVRRDALHYLLYYTPESFKSFWQIRILIRLHVAFAIIMIFLGPLQFWTGLRMRYLTLHTWCGRIFLVTGTYVASTAMYMGLHPRTGGIVMGIGLSLNGLLWLAAAAMAYYAIRLGNVLQHKEWMIRTYVLACNGIVGDRILADIPVLTRRIGIDAANDLSGWALWAFPLMVAEIVIQLRKLRRIRHPVKNAQSYLADSSLGGSSAVGPN
jgi:uncharacterized membrane protein